MEQLRLDFYFSPTPVDLAHATVVMRWRDDKQLLEAHWPTFKLTSWFASWPVALDHVFYPTLNDHVRMRVRV